VALDRFGTEEEVFALGNSGMLGLKDGILMDDTGKAGSLGFTLRRRSSAAVFVGGPLGMGRKQLMQNNWVGEVRHWVWVQGRIKIRVCRDFAVSKR